MRDGNDNYLAAGLMDDTNDNFRCRAYSSSDGGQAWTDRGFLPLNANTPRSNDPVVASDASGNFFIACLAMDVDSDPWDVVYWVSTNGGSSWSGPNTIAAGTGGVYNDKPWIAGDTKDSTSVYEGNVYACWTEIDSTVTPNTDKIKFKKIWPSTGSTKTIATGERFKEDPGTGEVQFCQVAVGRDGIIYVTWQRLVNSNTAKIQMKRSFDGGSTFESPSQLIKSFTRFPKTFGNCPTPPANEKLWGCLNGDGSSGIIAPATHSIAIDTINWNVHLAYSDYDLTGTLADVKYSEGSGCTTAGLDCTWSSSKKIVKDGNLAVDQWAPAIAISPDTNTIHVTALDRRNDIDNVNWRPWHYHCHYASADCVTTTANWFVTSITDQDSWNLDSTPIIGDYYGITSSAAREANALWVDTRLYLGQQDFNIFGDWTT